MYTDLLENLTLESILSLNDKSLYNLYIEEIANLSTNRIAKQVVARMQGESLIKIYNEIISQEELNRSYDLFNGDLVLLHGGKTEQQARSYITCDFSGSIIHPGSRYASYRPILENLCTSEVYVLKRTIKVEKEYYCDLPENIQDFESLQRYMQLEIERDDGINYSHLNRQTGGELTLKKLRKVKV